MRRDDLSARLRWISAFRLLFIGALLLYPVILTRLMHPETYSRYVFFFAIVGTAVQFSTLGVDLGLRRYLIEFRNTGRLALALPSVKFAGSIVMSVLLLLAVLMVILFAIRPGIFDGDVGLLVILALCIIFGGVKQLISGINYGLEQYALWSASDFAFAFLRIVFVPLLYVLYGFLWAFVGILLSYALTDVLVCVAAGIALKKASGGATRHEITTERKDILQFGLPLYLAQAFKRLSANVGVFALSLFLSKSDPFVGYFQLAALGVNTLSMLLDSFLFTIYPEIASAIDVGDRRRAENLIALESQYMLIFSWLLLGLIANFGRPVIHLLLPGYGKVYALIAFASILLIVRAVSLPISQLYLALKLTSRYLKVSIAWFVLYVAAYPLFGVRYGAWGVIIAFILSEALASVFMVQQVWKEMNVRPVVNLLGRISMISVWLLMPLLVPIMFLRVPCFLAISILWVYWLIRSKTVSSEDIVKRLRLLFLPKLGRTIMQEQDHGE